MYLYYTILEPAIIPENWHKYYQMMPADIQARVDRFKKNENQFQLVIGRLLLQRILQEEMGFSQFTLSDIQYDSFQKPYWKSDLYFSIAHSKNVIGCAVAVDQSIGLDIEYIQAIQIGNFSHILNQKDHQLLKESADSCATFFKLWTIKEAVSKADGRGLSMDVQQVYLEENQAISPDAIWDYHSIDIHPHFASHFVAPAKTSAIPTIKQLHF